MSITNYIQETLNQWGEPSLDSSPEFASAVAELKLKLCEAGRYDLSLSLPVEPTKRKVSAVAQFRRVLETIQQPVAVAVPESATTLTVKQAAAKYQLGLRTVYRLVENGMPVTKVGRAIRINPVDLELWLSEGEGELSEGEFD